MITLSKKISEKQAFLLLACAALALTAFSFVPSLSNGFTNWDDRVSLTYNTEIRDLSLNNVFYFFYDLRHASQDFYKPLVLLSYSIEYHFCGLDPGVYHFTNLTLHLINCLLVFQLIRLFGETPAVCFAVAALFGIHPMHVESVAWVSERKDVLYALFFLASMIAYLHHRQNNRPKSYWLCFLFFVLSLLSKPMAVTLPIVLLLMDLLVKRPLNIRTLLEKTPFLATAFLFGVLTLRTASFSPDPFPALHFPENLLTMSDALILYINTLLLPIRLSACYSLPVKPGHLLSGWPASPLLVLSGVMVIILFARRSRKLIFGSLFFLATILPTLHITPSAFLAADRYTYIPSLGLFYPAMVILHRVLDCSRSKWLKKYLFVSVLTVVLSFCAFWTWQRCGVWKNSLTLWNDVLEKCAATQDTAPVHTIYARVLAYNNRGFYYLSQNENEKAIADLDHALELAPQYGYHAHNHRGIAFGQMGQHARALEEFNEALRLKPDLAEAYSNRGYEHRLIKDYKKAFADFAQAVNLRPNYAPFLNNRGIEYNRMGRHDQALSDFNEAIRLDPHYAEAYNNRGNEFFFRGHEEKAFADYNRALILNPDFVDAYNNRGRSYDNREDFSRAIADYRRALEIDPNYELAKTNLRRTLFCEKEIRKATAALGSGSSPEQAKIYYNRGTLYAGLGIRTKAVADLNRAIELDPSLSEAYNNRGSIYQEMGKEEEALMDYKKAVALDPKFSQAYFNMAMIFKKKGRQEEALAAYQRVRELSKDNSS